jgi:hypothetical protein
VVLLLTLAGISDRQASIQTKVSRQTIGRWRRWLDESGTRFMFHLRSLFPSLGRLSESTAFWQQTMRSPGLALAMGSICRQGVIVP